MAKKQLARAFGQDLMKGEHVIGSEAQERNRKRGVRIDGDRRVREGGTLAPGRNGANTDGACADGTPGAPGTSIFDPVLCELVYRWFCPPGGLVLDPFAGGSVRGIVASKLGRRYLGVDLRPEQIAANEVQARRICDAPKPKWITGDSREIARLARGAAADLVFSCPPYGDLEIYSDDPADLSTLEYPAFVEAYRAIVVASLGLLKPDRFAVFVVGDLRDKAGFYRGFVLDTVRAFTEAGAALYNDAILVTAVRSLPIRVARQFEAARKLGKTHQNVLVFCKGDPRRATQAVGPVEFGVGEDITAAAPEGNRGEEAGG
jgi:hypothetical protein